MLSPSVSSLAHVLLPGVGSSEQIRLMCFVLSNTELPESCDGVQWEACCRVPLGYHSVVFSALPKSTVGR